MFNIIKFLNEVEECYLVEEGIDNKEKVQGDDATQWIKDEWKDEKKVMKINGQALKNGVGCATDDIPNISIMPE